MPIRQQLDSLLLYDPNRSRATVNVWVSRPTPTEEEALGKLFVIISIDTPSRINHEIISIIQDELRSSYYGQITVPFERAFEQALQSVNQRLHQLIADGVNQWLDHAHLLVGAVRQQQLIVSPVRAMYGYILRKSRLHDILGEPDTGRPNPLRVFAQIISGHLEPNDGLLFCAPTLLDYFSLEKLRRTLLDHPPHEAVRALESSLVGVDPSVSFGALIFRFDPAPERLASITVEGVSVPTRTAPLISMEELISREKNTEKLLAPSLWPAVKDMLMSVGAAGSRLFRTLVLRKPPRRVVPAGSRPADERPYRPSAPQTALRAAQSFGRAVSRGARMSVRFVRTMFRRPARESAPETGSGLRSMAGSPTSWLNRAVTWFRSLSRSQQVIAGSLAALLLIFTVSIVSSRNGAGPTPKADRNAYDTISEEIGKAQAALLYGGEESARTSLAAAEQAYASAPHKSSADKKKYAEAEQQITALRRQVAHETSVNDATLLANTAGVESGFQPQQLYLSKDAVFAFDPKADAIMAIPRTGSGQPQVKANTLDTGALTTGTLTATSLVFATDRNTFMEFDLKKQAWKPLDATLPAGDHRFQGLSAFQNYIYALDPSRNDIIRFSKGSASLGKGATWLKSPADLAEARAAVVEGSIFVLQPGGRIDEYFAGRKGTFALGSVTPALSDATRLWTDANAKHLYLLEPKNNRVVVFDKNGKLVDQYRSDAWTDLHDIVADESKHIAYVINGSSVYSITLLH